jgi:hypothetical protein
MNTLLFIEVYVCDSRGNNFPLFLRVIDWILELFLQCSIVPTV